MAEDPLAGAQRLDRWLWFARITKSRTLAQALIESGKVRLNRAKIAKTSAVVKPGDVLTVTLGPHVRNFEVVGIGSRRGPALEAQKLFRDLTPARPLSVSANTATEGFASLSPGLRTEGSGRPTKRDRRLIVRLKKDQSRL